MKFNYTLIVLSAIPYRMFLEAEQPEVQVLALLGDLEGKPPESIALEVLQVIMEDPRAESDRYKRLKQLRMLAQLRNFEFDYDKIQEDFMFSIGEIFKEERDPFFKRGLKRGEEKGMEKGIEKEMKRMIQNLIINTGGTDEEIARNTDVPMEVVSKIRAKMID